MSTRARRGGSWRVGSKWHSSYYSHSQKKAVVRTLEINITHSVLWIPLIGASYFHTRITFKLNCGEQLVGVRVGLKEVYFDHVSLFTCHLLLAYCHTNLCQDFSRSSYTSDIDTPAAALPSAWCYRVSTRTGLPSVSILWLGEIESLICDFYLSVVAHTVVCADPSLRVRYTNMLLGS